MARCEVQSELRSRVADDTWRDVCNNATQAHPFPESTPLLVTARSFMCTPLQIKPAPKYHWLALFILGKVPGFQSRRADSLCICGCIQKFPDWVHNEINNNNKHSLRSNKTFMAAKLTRLTYKTPIQLHLAEESCNICSSRSRRPVRKLFDTPLVMRFSVVFLSPSRQM